MPAFLPNTEIPKIEAKPVKPDSTARPDAMIMRISPIASNPAAGFKDMHQLMGRKETTILILLRPTELASGSTRLHFLLERQPSKLL